MKRPKILPVLRRNSFLKPVAVYHVFAGLPAPEKDILATARLLYAAEKIPPGQKTHVILCSNRAIRRLNAMFRHAGRATDVLSFNYDEPDLLGEIYISLQKAKVQAKEYGGTYRNEVRRLFVHGMFHLLGYDHETAKEANLMQKKELKYLN